MSGVKINTNVPALKALRQLNEHYDVLGRLTERLASGQRINRAGDDAASLAIASALSADRRVYSQAIRNVNDGVSMLSFADSALTALGNIVTRQKELAEQAANGSFTRAQRLALNKEADALTDEFNRIVSSTTFNGQELLSGAATNVSLQVGNSGSDSLNISLGNGLARNAGTGSFVAASTLTVGSNPNLIQSGDLNNDGHADIVAANENGSSVSVLLGNGNGTFAAAVSFAVGEQPSTLTLTDLDQDGILDIVTSDYGVAGLGTSASLLLGNGNGTFAARTTVPAGLGPVALAIGDMNNDGISDIITGTASANFVSGSNEVTTIITPLNGLNEITDVTFVAVPVQEVTTITTPAVTTGVQEISTIAAIATATREATSITAAAANNGTAEVTTITAIDVAVIEETEIATVAASAMVSGNYFTISSLTTDYYVWYNIDSAGGDPTPGGTGIEVAIDSTDTADEVATKTAAAIDARAELVATANTGLVTVTNTTGGAVTDAADFDIGGAFNIVTTVQGTNSSLANGDYFYINSHNTNYYAWFNIGGTGVDPAIGGRTGIQINLDWGDSASEVATAIESALDGVSGGSVYSASTVGNQVTVTRQFAAAVTDASDQTVGGAFTVATSVQGVNADIRPGDYFLISSTSTNYYVWFSVDGFGTNPAIGGRTGLQVSLTSADDADAVAAKIKTALDGLGTMTTGRAGATLSITNNTGGSVTDAADGNIGAPFAVSITTQGVNSSLASGDYFYVSSPTTNYYVWFNIAGTGVNPSIGGRTGIEVALSWDSSADTVAAAIESALDAVSGGTVFNASRVTNTVTLTNQSLGVATNAQDVTVGGAFSVNVTQQGTNNDIQPGDHFYLNSPSTAYYVWYRVDGVGVNPAVGGRTGLMVDLLSTDNSNQVASKLATAIDGLADLIATPVGNQVTVTSVYGGTVTNASDINVGGGFSISVATQGTNSIINNSSYFTFDTPSTNYYVWFNLGGLGVDPAVGGRTGIEIALNWGDTATTAAIAVAAAINPLIDADASRTGTTVRITNTVYGIGAVAQGTIAGLPITQIQDGVTPPIVSGQYFTFDSLTTDYYVWYNVNGAGGDPMVAGRTGVQVNINHGSTASQVGTLTAAALDALAGITASSVNGTITATVDSNGFVDDAGNFNVGTGFSIGVAQQGTETRVDPVTNSVITPDHGFSTGLLVRLTTSGTLPGGLSTGVNYYVIRVDNDTIRFATSLANALANNAIDITNFGSGIHSISVPGQSTGAGLALGNGDGSFGSVTEFQVSESPNVFTTADVNSDGNLDLITAGITGMVEISLGNGSGQLSSLGTYQVGTTPSSVVVRDFNADGIIDIATGNSGSNSTSILLGNGDGTFRSATNYAIGSDPRSMISADINNDGIGDLIAADYNSGAGTGGSVLFGQYNGSFSAPTTFTAGNGARAVASNDFNNDGVADLAVANRADSTVSVLYGVAQQVTTSAYLNIRDEVSARAALLELAGTMDRVNAAKATIGAAMSRLSTTISFLQTQNIELAQAESRIMDIDTAEVVSEYTRRSILANATAAVLSSANQAPAIALRLLKID